MADPNDLRDLIDTEMSSIIGSDYDALSTEIKAKLIQAFANGINTHGDNEWSGAGTPLSTKGDLLVHNGTTEVRLPVGANDLVLVANSAVARGVEWASVPTQTHSNLTDLSWASSGHTGTALRLAGFGAAGGTTQVNMSAKGALATSTGSALTNLGVGSDDQVLIADSGQSTGLRWGAVAISHASASDLAWASSGHTGNANSVAGFGPAGAAFSITGPTTTGDLWAGNGTLPTVLGVGSDDQVLIADSGEATGLRWGAVAISHAAASDLAWASSGHTGTASTLAAFGPAGAALTVAAPVTKGDVLSSNGTAPTVLGVGSNDQVLIADSGEATGLRWGAVAISHAAASDLAWGSSGHTGNSLRLAGFGSGGATTQVNMSGKGALVTSTGSALTNLGVGSNDQVLIADSGEASGLRWGAVAISHASASDLAWASSGHTGTALRLAGFGSGGATDQVNMSAKGALATSTGSALTNLGVGSDGESLVADSGESTGLRWGRLFNSTTSDPGSSDDTGSGYEVGSQWVNTTSDTVWMCVDATASSAVWKLISQNLISVRRSSTVSFAGTPTHVPFNLAELNADANASLNTGTGEITINATGIYLLTYTLMAEETGGSFGDWRANWQRDTGSGFSDLIRTYAGNRTIANQEASATCAEVAFTLNSGDKLRVVAERINGSGTLRTKASTPHAVVRRIG